MFIEVKGELLATADIIRVYIGRRWDKVAYNREEKNYYVYIICSTGHNVELKCRTEKKARKQYEEIKKKLQVDVLGLENRITELEVALKFATWQGSEYAKVAAEWESSLKKE